MVRKSQNLEMSQKITKKSLRKKVLPQKEEINAILLVLLFEEFSIPPEPSSQPRFRFLGGTMSVTKEKQQDGNPCV